MDWGSIISFLTAPPLSMSVARNPCMVQMLQEKLPETRMVVPELPDLTGAWGAALHGANY
jgi:activator of 2-hydroxyglutaryl-CoA dehydratase